MRACVVAACRLSLAWLLPAAVDAAVVGAAVVEDIVDSFAVLLQLEEMSISANSGGIKYLNTHCPFVFVITVISQK